MSKLGKASEFRVRVDGLMDDRFIAFLERFATRYLLVHHTTTTENPHYHAFVKTAMDQANFSKYIKKHLEVSGSDYSNKICHEERRGEYLSYLFNTKKGNVPRYVSSKSFTQQDIDDARASAESIAVAYEKRKKKFGPITQFGIVVKAIERIKENRMLFNPSTIYDEVVQISKDHGKVIRYGQLKDMINTALAFSEDKVCVEYSKKSFLYNYGDFPSFSIGYYD